MEFNKDNMKIQRRLKLLQFSLAGVALKLTATQVKGQATAVRLQSVVQTG